MYDLVFICNRTAKHFTFQFQPSNAIPDTSVVAIASNDALLLGLLSSKHHIVWATAVGGRLGFGNDTRYQHASTFNPFPFPILTAAQQFCIRGLGEELDAHRKRQQAQHPALTFTGMYNVLEKIRAAEPLTDKDKIIHEQGLVSVLKQIHDDLDAAVFDAYSWPAKLSDDEILERLVALNAERAAEEAQGLIRWLRPEFQNPTDHKAATQGTLIEDVVEEPEAKMAKKRKAPWPKTLAEQAQAIRAALAAQRSPATPDQLAKTFLRANVERVDELLETLASLGQARELDDGRFVAPMPGR